MSKPIPHFQGAGKIGEYRPRGAVIQCAGSPGIYKLLDLDWQIKDMPHLAKAHLDVTSTLRIDQLRLIFNYHGFINDGMTSIESHIDKTFERDEFKALILNSNFRGMQDIQEPDSPGSEALHRQMRTDVVNGFGNYASEGTDIVQDPTSVQLFFGETGTYEEAGMSIGPVAFGSFDGFTIIDPAQQTAEQFPEIYGTSLPPSGNQSPFPFGDFWRLYRFDIYTQLSFYDPAAGIDNPNNQETGFRGKGNTLFIGGISPENIGDSGITWRGIKVPSTTGMVSGSWISLQGGPFGGATWDYTLSLAYA